MPFPSLHRRRAKTAPSSYPATLFHAVRCAQLLSSVVVGGIMSYFLWHLTHDHWKAPWTFIWLASASLFSIAALAFTMLLHCCVGLNPRFNLAINAFLLVLWALSWALLTYYMSATLSHMCDVEHWNEEVGIMICRIYKALFAFTLIGFLSTIGAFALDIYVHRRNTHRGAYKLQDVDTHLTPEANRGLFVDAERTQARESDTWDDPLRENYGGQQGGYAVPGAHFSYDTGYHNGPLMRP